MNKKEVIKMAEKLETCYNEDFCDAMEELAQVAYMDLSFDD